MTHLACCNQAPLARAQQHSFAVEPVTQCIHVENVPAAESEVWHRIQFKADSDLSHAFIVIIGLTSLFPAALFKSTMIFHQYS